MPMVRLALICALSAAVSGAQESPQARKITVKASSVSGRTLLVEADLAGKAIELECQTTQDTCAKLPPADYYMVSLKDAGVYMDCANVDVYAANANLKRDKALGTYCLLQG